MNPTTAVDRPFYERNVGDHGYVSIRRTEGASGAITFRVCARHTPPRGSHSLDYYEADAQELAFAIVRKAEEILQSGETPNLPEIGADLKRRGFVHTIARPIFGGRAILGDTAPDEAPRKP